MTWPFENDTRKIEKKLAKKVFKQIAQETSLLLFQLF